VSLEPGSSQRRSCAGSSDFFLRELEQYQWPDQGSAARIYKVKHAGIFIMNHEYILGIDVAKAKLDIALRRPNGKFRSKVVSNTPDGFKKLSEWLRKQGADSVHACMEATGIYHESVAEFLADTGHTVSVVNPARIKAFGAASMSRTKTDKKDARLIAQFCAEKRPSAWEPPSETLRELRALVARRDALEVMRIQERNRKHVARAAVLEGIEKHLEYLEDEIEHIDSEIKRKIDDDPDLKKQRKLLDGIPGLGPKTIPVLLSFFGGVLRFDNARQAAAYAGLDPKQHQSGTSINLKTRISKMGHVLLRKALYMPAMVSVNRTDWGRAFKARLSANGKAPKVIICAMMRKLVHVAFGVLRSGEPFNAMLHNAA
jgi:transposase